MNPYVFIVGCPRSGTTLLQRMVDAHAEIAIPRETHWIPESFKRQTGITADGFVTHELLESLLAHPKFGNLGIEREELELLLATEGRLSYAKFISALFDLYGERRGKRLVGDKTPGYVREIAILHGLWPRARFVHLIRDGRDVCLSATSWERKAQHFRRRFRTWDDDPTTTAALWWTWHVRLGLEAGARLASDLYYEIRYETLVTDPESECRKLCAFLDVAFDPTMLRYHEGRTRPAAHLSAKRAWLPPTPGLRDWRTQMPAEALQRFEAAAGDLLDELGYARGIPQPAAESLERTSRIAAVFREDAPASGRPLPERW